MAQKDVRASTIKHYDHYYHEDTLSQWRQLGATDKARNILMLCRNLPRQSVLEIGAGEGAVLKRLSEIGFAQELYALEISSSAVNAILGKKIPQLHECVLFDGYTTPYADGRFDIVILSHVVEHAEHPRLLLYEASRIGKFIFVEVPLEDTFRLPNNFVPTNTGHINTYSLKTIRRLLQSCGLEVLNQIVMNPSKAVYQYKNGFKGSCHYYLKETALSLVPGVAPLLFSYHAALLCSKNSKPECSNKKDRSV